MSNAAALVIRQASAQDAALLMDFYRQLEFGPARELSVAMAMAAFEGLAACPDFRVYIAEREGVPAGTFSLLIFRTLAHGGRPFGIVEDVVVHAAQRRHGVGKDMMAFAMERCRQADCYKLALSSHLERVDAHVFYESLGFARHGYSFLVT